MILIDADPLVYGCGFAAQKSHSKIVVEDEAGNLFQDMTDDLGVWKREHKGYKVLEREVTVEAEPESYAIQNIRLAISGIKAECVKAGYEDPTVFYSAGGELFRDRIATLLPYKGNRDKLHKPVHYAAIRDWLSRNDAIAVAGIETDDEISIRGWDCLRARQKCVVASIDKDLDQIPGKHYNPNTGKFYNVSRADAELWFWTQVLSGDSTDNIGGCWKVGSAGAAKLLSSVSPPYWPHVVKCYEESQGKAGCPYSNKDPSDVALENARLVYMLRNREESTKLWTP